MLLNLDFNFKSFRLDGLRRSERRNEGGSDPAKDKDQIDSTLDAQLGLSEDDERLEGLDPDREGLDKRNELETENLTRRETGDRREPEVVIDREEPKVDVVSPDSPLGRALATIESLKGDVEDLRRGSGSRQDREEPVVETIEILPGVRLPKDVNRWPIKITDSDLVRMGWNDEHKGPAEVLNILGNALYTFVVETVPQLATQNVESKLTAQTRAQQVQSEFEGLYPHLAPHRDIVDLVERRERQNPNSTLRGKFGKDYYHELGRLGEAKMANINGLTVEQYRARAVVKRGNDTERRGGSRAVSAGGNTRRGNTRPENDFERDSKDLDDI